MFEWGGGCLWAGNDAAYEAFDVGPIEDRLPLSDDVLRRLDELSAWHDTALDWEDPAGPSPWTPDEDARFDAAAQQMLHALQAQLGNDFEVIFQPL
jgi:hypothetical protein